MNIITLIFALPAVLFSLVCLYLLLLTIAAWFYRPPRTGGHDKKRFAVIIPAHNEEGGISETITRILSTSYPRNLLTPVVVADNCTDRTPLRAREAGATVFERRDPDHPGKGQALDWLLSTQANLFRRFDGLVFLDADCYVNDAFFHEASATLDRETAPVVQGYSCVANPLDNRRTALVAAAFAVFNRLRPAGRAGLGGSAGLKGLGMAFDAETLLETGWPAHSAVEDLEFTATLIRKNIKVVYNPDMVVLSEMAVTRKQADIQRKRWEGGRFAVAKALLPGLVRDFFRTPSMPLADMIFELACPPLSMLIGMGMLLAGLTWMAAPILLPLYLFSLVVVVAYVVSGLLLARVPAGVWKHLAGAPLFLFWKLGLYLKMLVKPSRISWDRTPRNREVQNQGPADSTDSKPAGRELAVFMGIPFDNLTMEETCEAIEDCIASGKSHLLATANVNFVVKALHDPEFREIVQMADIITADGMPILWASRLLGHPLKERVTGADLVPAMAAVAARKGYRIMLLGGAPGVGDTAVANLKTKYPGLEVTAFCPPFDPLLEINSEAILKEIHAVAPDMLFVSFTAGKSEKWIRMNLKDLNVPLSAGVGATIDFLAGRVSRAPKWVQNNGLEWIYRIVQEPGRMWRRYAVDFFYFSRAFVVQFVRYRLQLLKGAPERLASQEQASAPQPVTILTGRVDATCRETVRDHLQPKIANGETLILDLSGVTLMDSTGMGLLVGLEKTARSGSGRLILSHVSDQAMAGLRAARLDKLFTFTDDHELAAAMASAEPDNPVSIVDRSQDSLHLAVTGRIDAESGKEIAETLRAHYTDSTSPRIRLDLDGVPFIDSSGLKVLISAHKELHETGQRLELANLRPEVAQLFQLMKIDRYLNLV